MARLVLAKGRAADLDALAAATALLDGGHGLLGAVHQAAGRLEDDDGEQVLVGRCLLEGGTHLLEVLRVCLDDLVHADGLAQGNQVQRLAGRAVQDGGLFRRVRQRRDALALLGQGDAVHGVALRAGHGSGAVVQNAEGALAAVVGGAEKAGDAGVREGGVADDTHHRAAGAPLGVCQLHAVAHAERGAHVYDGVHGLVGRDGTQRVAADVASDNGLDAAQLAEDKPVRAASAEGGRTRRQALRGVEVLRQGRAEAGLYLPREDLPGAGQGLGGRLTQLDAQSGHVVAEVAAGLLHHIDLVHLGGEVRQRTRRQRPGEAQLEGRCVGQGLAHVVVEGAGHDDAHLGVAVLCAVEVAGLRVLRQGVLAGVGHVGAGHGVGGHHDVLVGLAGVVAGGKLRASAGHLHHGLGVSDAHGLVQHDGRVELLGELEGALGVLVGLLGVRRVQAGNAREGRVVAGVLLVLAGIHGRVVCHQEHQACIDTGVGHTHVRVRRHVQTHVLHGHQRADAAHGGANAHLKGDLLVGGPLAVHVLVVDQVLERLRRRRAGVAGADLHSGLPCALRYGLVAGKQLFAHVSLPMRQGDAPFVSFA